MPRTKEKINIKRTLSTGLCITFAGLLIEWCAIAFLLSTSARHPVAFSVEVERTFGWPFKSYYLVAHFSYSNESFGIGRSGPVISDTIDLRSSVSGAWIVQVGSLPIVLPVGVSPLGLLANSLVFGLIGIAVSTGISVMIAHRNRTYSSAMCRDCGYITYLGASHCAECGASLPGKMENEL